MSPRQEWPNLAQTVERFSGLPSNSTLSLLEAIEAPDALWAFAAICRNLIVILPVARDLASQDPDLEAPDPDDIDDWLDLCHEIVRDPGRYEPDAPGLAIVPRTEGIAPLHGWFEPNPLYVMLWYFPKKKSDGQAPFATLLAHLFLASFRLSRVEDPTDYHAAKNWAGQIARRFLKPPLDSTLLPRLPTRPLKAEAYCDALRKLAADQPYPDLLRIATLVGYGINPKHSRMHARNAQPSRWPPLEDSARLFAVDSAPSDASDGEGNAARRSVLKLEAFSKTEHETWVESGCSPDEASAGVEFVALDDEPGRLMTGRRPRDYIARTRAAVSALAARNQLLPLAWGSLTIYEVAVLFEGIDRLAAERCNKLKADKVLGLDDEPKVHNLSNKGPDAGLELAALLTAIFWTSRPIEDLAGCPLMTTDPAGPARPIVYVSVGRSGHWSIEPAKPTARQRLDPSAATQAESTVERLALRTNNGSCAESILDRFVHTLPHVPAHRRPLFTREPDVYRRALAKILVDLNEEHGCRLTLGRISAYLFHRLAVRTGSDATAAAMITGRDECLARSSLHYAALPVRELQRLYAAASAEIVMAVRAERPHAAADRPSSRRSLSGVGHIGSRFRPTLACVQGLERSLRAKLEAARRKPEGPERTIALHNAVTLYTHWLIAFATGYRAVRNAFFHETEIDHVTGFAVISDKDGDDYYHTRLIWLPPIVIEQIELWCKHWRFLRRHHLRALNLELYYDLVRRDNTAKKPDTAQRRSRRRAAGAVEGLFLFDIAGKSLPLRPGIVSEYTGPDFLLRTNAGRHYLRSRLFELKCPAEVTAAFMGHWERGEEPWGRYSGLSPLEYREALAPCLKKILREIGWSPQPGFGEREL